MDSKNVSPAVAVIVLLILVVVILAIGYATHEPEDADDGGDVTMDNAAAIQVDPVEPVAGGDTPELPGESTG